MKKGDLRRTAILDAAEKLFFDKGYEATNVQDILDALGLSKGGFYHHFETKQAVLEAICERRAEAKFEALSAELATSREGAVARLNKILKHVNLFEREDAPFIAMVLRVSYLEGDMTLIDRINETTNRLAFPALERAVQEGLREKAFTCRFAGQIGRILMAVAHCAEDDAARLLTQHIENPEAVIEVVDLLNACRDAVERLLNAPFGSISLFEVDHILTVCREAAKLMREESA